MEPILITTYRDEYRQAFARLNKNWLDRYGLTESHDLEVLNDPRTHILEPGGYIFIALAGNRLVGSVALIKESDAEFELAKMAVAPDSQGRGISKLLLEASVSKARSVGARRIFLFSNHQLTRAIGLYEKFGFSHIPVTGSPFATADVKMELSL